MAMLIDTFERDMLIDYIVKLSKQRDEYWYVLHRISHPLHGDVPHHMAAKAIEKDKVEADDYLKDA